MDHDNYPDNFLREILTNLETTVHRVLEAVEAGKQQLL